MMKIYGIIKKLSRKKVGDLSPLPKMNDKDQLYFCFYGERDLSMEKRKVLRKKKRSRYSKGISKEASSLVTRTKETSRS